ncbi:MAG: ATP-binding protein [Anaerovoracaceae bacterium]
MKIVETEKITSKLTLEYQENNFNTFIDGVKSISETDDVFIRIESTNGVIFSPSDELQGYEGELKIAREKLKTKLDNPSSISMVLTGEKTKRETWAYAGYLDASQEIILYVLAPLYPVSSTITILSHQLFNILLILIVLAFILSYFLSSRIAKPIKSINRSAKHLANGEYGITFSSDLGYSEINDLANTLNKASLELEKSVVLQKDLMANVSHDLRTPLTMVKSYAEMIRDLSGDIPEKRNAHLQVIIDESDRLNTLVNDVLTLSTIQAGTLTLAVKAFSLKELIQTIIQPYEILEETEGYSIQFNCRNDVLVKGDPDRIKQVVSNLLTNAIKYCGEDKKIFINLKRWGKKVHCEVVDHGVGIKPDELPYVWERYYKTSSNHVRQTKGSGLGLSIVKQILLAHNSRFGVESKVGRGTTFWFELGVYEPIEKPHKREWRR